MGMKKLVLGIALLLGAACTDDVDSASFAVDADENGTVDCHDLEHVMACLADPHSDACAHADVNGDGVVDDQDVHDIYDGLEATGHHCTDPDDPHHP